MVVFVSVILSPWGNAMSAYMVVLKNVHHGLCHLGLIEAGLRIAQGKSRVHVS